MIKRTLSVFVLVVSLFVLIYSGCCCDMALPREVDDFGIKEQVENSLTRTFSDVFIATHVITDLADNVSKKSETKKQCDIYVVIDLDEAKQLGKEQTYNSLRESLVGIKGIQGYFKVIFADKVSDKFNYKDYEQYKEEDRTIESLFISDDLLITYDDFSSFTSMKGIWIPVKEMDNGYFTTIVEWVEDDCTYKKVYANDTKIIYLIIENSNGVHHFRSINAVYNEDGSLQFYTHREDKK